MNTKKVLALVAAAGIIAAASTAFAAKSIVGTKHDLSFDSGNGLTLGSNTQICIYCHTPHTAVKANVLWNRSDSGQTFTLYSGVGMENVSYKTGLTADSTSLFCMSCHDGATDMSASSVQHGTKTGLTTGVVTSTAALSKSLKNGLGAGTDGNLSRTHPINFPVGATNSQADLWVGSGAYMGNGASGTAATTITGTKGFPLFRSARDIAGQTRTLECGSCHAVHDSENKPFLRYTMDKSTLCLGCHNK